jgi:hypothetical protein
VRDVRKISGVRSRGRAEKGWADWVFTEKQ